jgi:spore coat protein CotH
MATGRTLAGAALALILLAIPGKASAQTRTLTADDLFNDQVLQRVDLWMNTRDWSVLKYEYETNNHYPANVKWNGLTAYNVAVRSRGLGSRSGEKPGLHLDFQKWVVGGSFVGLTQLNLNNLVQDPTAVREVLAMKVLRLMGMPAPRIALCSLYINNAFYGAYILVEQPDTEWLQRAYGESKGYLYNYSWLFQWGFEYVGSDLTVYQQMFKSKDAVSPTLSDGWGPIEAMVRTINNASDQDFVAAASQYMDLPPLMRFFGAQAYLADPDGVLGAWGVNNTYLYKFAGRNFFQFIAWDASSALFNWDYVFTGGLDSNVLMRRCMTDLTLRAAYFQGILDAAAMADEGAGPGQPGWLETEITRLSGLNRADVYRETHKPYTNADYDAAIVDILNFARTRGALARVYVARLTGPGGPYPTTLSSVPGGAGTRKDASRTPAIRTGPRR